jgi:hypothetical protein
MNVSLRHFIAFWFLLFSSFSLYSQAIVLETYQNTSLVHNFSSSPFAPQITEKPENGSARLLNLGNGQYDLVYDPGAGFIGADELEYSYWAPPSDYKRVTVYINVLPSEVNAIQDFAGTPTNISVDIDVLNNDESTSGSLAISNISMVNNGEVLISEDGAILTFVPDADFQGIAHFNYIACDEAGVCDQGTVSINVYGEDNSDTLTVFTKKNQPQSIFIPSNFTVTEYPWNGFFDDFDEIPQYYPDYDFVGSDYIIFEDNGMQKVVEIIVLDLVENTFANDDEVFTTTFSPVEFNVLENDLYGATACSFNFTQPQYGTLEVVEGEQGGTLKYTPAEGFLGVDQFTYTSKDPGCAYDAEEATVYVYVSNFEPVYNRFQMSTVKGTPLVVAYSIPIAEYKFEINQAPNLGELLFLEGQVDTIVRGQRIKGYNILLYVPNEDVSEGLDEFELNYCVFDGDQCTYQKYLKIEMDILDLGNGEAFCFNDCVWSGDTNLDGIVDINDLLPIGLYMGESGPARDDAQFPAWYGEYSENWGMVNANNDKDLKHIDADGEGIITAFDTSSIGENYGRTHSLTPKSLPNIRNTIVLKGNTEASLGDVIQFDIYMGTEESPAEDVYGFTFPIQYNPDFFDPKGMNVTFDNSSWLNYSSGAISMIKNDLNGQLDAGFTRTNGIKASGFGKIGSLSVVIVDDIDGIKPGQDKITVSLDGGFGSISNSAGSISGVKLEGLDITIDLTKPSSQELDKDSIKDHDIMLQTFPNPTFDQLNVHFNGGREFQRVQLFNLTGQRVFDTGKVSERTQSIDMSQLNAGMYLLRVQTAEGLITRKIEKID